MFTVKEAAEIMGISPHALRFYDNEGLLPTLSRQNKRRLFTYEDLEWVHNIQCWRATGMPLSEIRRYIELAREGDSTIDERYDMILKQRDRAVEEVKAAKQRVKILQRKVMWYQDLKRGADPSKWRPNMQAIVQKALSQKKKDEGKKEEKKRAG